MEAGSQLNEFERSLFKIDPSSHVDAYV